MTIDPTVPRLTSLREQIFAAYNDIAHYVPHRASALFRKEVDALLSVPSPQPEWLPIETAPKDGTTVGLVNAAGERGVGVWSGDRWISAQTDEKYQGYSNLGTRIVGWCPFALPPLPSTLKADEQEGTT